MPTTDPEILEASDIADVVCDQARAYAHRVLVEQGDDYPHVDALIAQHVQVQLACLKKDWSRSANDKAASALTDMGTGLMHLSSACGKHSLHVKMVHS